MLTASVLWGIFLTTGLFRRRKVALLDMHRWLSGLTLFFIAVALTSMARKKLAKKWWRDVHIFSYVMFWSVTIHGALAGTDATTMLYRIAGIVVLSAVVAAVSFRALSQHVRKRPAANAASRLSASTTGTGTMPQARPVGTRAR